MSRIWIGVGVVGALASSAMAQPDTVTTQAPAAETLHGRVITGTLANAFNNRTPDVLGTPIPGRLMWLQLAYDSDGLHY